MNKKRVFKIITILVLFVILSTNIVYADGGEQKSYKPSGKSIWEIAKSWLKLGQEQREESTIKESSYEGFEEIAGLLWGAGIFIIAIIGVILGIRYMISAPEEKANLKKMLIPYLVGTVMILGAAGIWKIIVDLLEDIAQN